tara:strand:- start:1797 stop:2216 length:420 start_codon:yes stop_codon:yes gene_type:complete
MYMKKNFLQIVSSAAPLGVVVFVPNIVSAGYFGQVDDFFTRATGFIDNILIPLVFTVALLVFLYGMFNYFIVQGDNEQSREVGRHLMLWSVIGFVVMVSIWGIVNMIAGGLFGSDNRAPDIPGTPTVQGGTGAIGGSGS